MSLRAGLIAISLMVASTVATRGQADFPFGAPTRIVPNTALGTAIKSVGYFSGVPVGFESAVTLSPEVHLDRPLEVATMKPSLAVHSLVDPKTYMVQEVSGAIIVRPRERTGAGAWLDTPLTPSKASGNLMDALQMIRESSTRLISKPRNAPALRGGMAKEVSLRGTTVAQVLTNAIVAHGSAGWTVYYRPNANKGEGGLTRMLQIFTYDGSSAESSLGRSGEVTP